MNNERKYCVYKHTSPSNKVYIGITKNLKQRWGANGKHYIKNNHFVRAINKYGWDNFKHEILFNNLTINEAKSKEIELIAYYDSTNPTKGYNISLGGDIMSESSKKKLSKILKEKGLSDKKLELIRNNSRKINQYDLQGNFIKTWDCFYDIKNKLIPNADDSHIYSCCNRKTLKSAYGYQWRYFDDCNDIQPYLRYDKNSYNTRKEAICEISLIDGSIIKIYESSKQAREELGFNVSVSITNRQSLVHGRLFIKLSDYDNKEYINQRLKQIKHTRKTSSKAIEEVDKNGNILGKYKSIKEASKILGISHYGIGEVCSGKNKTTANGRIFRYIN